MGLLEDDSHWVTCLNEATLISIPRALRVLFCNILVYCFPSEPDKLLEKFHHSMSEDFKRVHEQHQLLSEEDIEKHTYNDLLTTINKILLTQEKQNDSYCLPMPDNRIINPTIISTSERDPNASSFYAQNRSHLNLEQEEIFQMLKGHFDRGEGVEII